MKCKVFILALFLLSISSSLFADLTIKNNGKVGIGNSQPLSKLDIYSPVAITDWWPYDAYMLRLESGSANNPLNTIQIIKSYGSAESELRFDNEDDILGAVYTLSNDYSLKFLVASPEWNHVTFDATASGDLEVRLRSDLTDAGAIVFNTTWDPHVSQYASKIYRPSNSTDLVINLSGVGDVMTFDSATGNVGIGTTSPAYTLQVGNAGDGTEARANAWNTFSDITLKTNLVKIQGAVKMVTRLNGYFFNWRKGTNTDRQVGVVAQEVEKVLPEIVSEEGTGLKSLDYGKLVPLLIEAIKEQQRTIGQLSKEMEEIKKELDLKGSITMAGTE